MKINSNGLLYYRGGQISNAVGMKRWSIPVGLLAVAMGSMVAGKIVTGDHCVGSQGKKSTSIGSQEDNCVSYRKLSDVIPKDAKVSTALLGRNKYSVSIPLKMEADLRFTNIEGIYLTQQGQKQRVSNPAIIIATPRQGREQASLHFVIDQPPEKGAILSVDPNVLLGRDGLLVASSYTIQNIHRAD